MSRFARWVVASILLLVYVAPISAEDEKIWLAADGKARVTIVSGGADDFAAERLQRWFAQKANVKVGIVVAEDGRFPDGVTSGDCVILLGSLDSNPLLRTIARQLGLKLDPAELTEQGYVARQARHDGRQWLILAGGGRDGVIHAVADLMNWHLNASDKGAWLGQLDTRRIPRFKYRWFWTWDHRMDWGGPGKVGTLMGGGGTFSKQPEAFLIDYKRCVDYMADHKFNGLIIWGFLRDTHGGVAASQELCRYAARRGVRILPGVGTSGYAGYYFEGKHPFNAKTWLAKRPHLRATRENGKPCNVPCPSKKANQDWLDRGAQWMFENFQVGGVNLEMGDFFVCYCDDCKKARAGIKSSEPDYYKDMAISHEVTLKTMRRLAPEAWLSYATYTGYTAKMMNTPPKFLSMIPQDALCQWTLTHMAYRWRPDVKPKAKHNVGYLHWCNGSTHTEDDFYLERVRDICRNAAATGFEGLDTYGELPDTKLNAEISYLAWEAFLWQPEMTLEQFAEERLGRIYGGGRAARALLEIIPLICVPKVREEPDNYTKARKLAVAARNVASPEGHGRWDKLIEHLDRTYNVLEECRLGTAARKGRKLPVLSLKASDEDIKRGWAADRAIDGSVKEPEGYWLTQRVDPPKAWLELTLVRPEKINRVALFHQINPGHYRSRDYVLSVRADGKWKPVVKVKGNIRAGWMAHRFDTVTTDAVRLDITRSAHGSRMGIGEIELRMEEDQ